MERPISLIANVNSGSRDRRQIDDLRQRLAAALAEPVRFLPVADGDDIAEACAEVRKAGRGTVFVAGGDGTLSGAASHLAGSGVTMAPLPLGTFNFFCRGLDLPENTDEAIAALLHGEVAHQPVGCINDRLFLNNCSFGLYPAILAAREDIYGTWGRSRLAAYWSVIKTILNPGRRLRLKVTADGVAQNIRTPMVFVGANPYQLDFYALDGADHPRSGRLALLYGTDTGSWGMILGAIRIALGLARHSREFRLIAGREITLELPRRKATVAIDGERIRVREPIRLTLRHDVLRVLRPARKASRVAA